MYSLLDCRAYNIPPPVHRMSPDLLRYTNTGKERRVELNTGGETEVDCKGVHQMHMHPPLRFRVARAPPFHIQ